MTVELATAAAAFLAHKRALGRKYRTEDATPSPTLSMGISGDWVRTLHYRLLDLDTELARDEAVEGCSGGITCSPLSAARAATSSPIPRWSTLQAFDAEHLGYVVGLDLRPDERPVPELDVVRTRLPAWPPPGPARCRRRVCRSSGLPAQNDGRLRHRTR